MRKTKYQVHDILTGKEVSLADGTPFTVTEPPHSVRMLKIANTSLSPAQLQPSKDALENGEAGRSLLPAGTRQLQ
jgi:hypothetical protein